MRCKAVSRYRLPAHSKGSRKPTTSQGALMTVINFAIETMLYGNMRTLVSVVTCITVETDLLELNSGAPPCESNNSNRVPAARNSLTYPTKTRTNDFGVRRLIAAFTRRFLESRY